MASGVRARAGRDSVLFWASGPASGSTSTRSREEVVTVRSSDRVLRRGKKSSLLPSLCRYAALLCPLCEPDAPGLPSRFKSSCQKSRRKRPWEPFRNAAKRGKTPEKQMPR